MPRIHNLFETIAIGDRLRALRKDRNISQSDLAVLIDVSYQQLQKYESGRTALTVPAMKVIAAALGVKPCEICGCCDDG